MTDRCFESEPPPPPGVGQQRHGPGPAGGALPLCATAAVPVLPRHVGPEPRRPGGPRRAAHARGNLRAVTHAGRRIPLCLFCLEGDPTTWDTEVQSPRVLKNRLGITVPQLMQKILKFLKTLNFCRFCILKVIFGCFFLRFHCRFKKKHDPKSHNQL